MSSWRAAKTDHPPALQARLRKRGHASSSARRPKSQTRSNPGSAAVRRTLQHHALTFPRGLEDIVDLLIPELQRPRAVPQGIRGKKRCAKISVCRFRKPWRSTGAEKRGLNWPRSLNKRLFVPSLHGCLSHDLASLSSSIAAQKTLLPTIAAGLGVSQLFAVCDADSIRWVMDGRTHLVIAAIALCLYFAAGSANYRGHDPGGVLRHRSPMSALASAFYSALKSGLKRC